MFIFVIYTFAVKDIYEGNGMRQTYDKMSTNRNIWDDKDTHLPMTSKA